MRGSGYSLWPTTTAKDRDSSRTFNRETGESMRANAGPTLTDKAEMWQTPGTDSFRSRGGDRKDEMGLDQQARLLWKTPGTDEPGVSASRLVTKDGAPWRGGERAYDAENGRLAQTGLPQMVEIYPSTHLSPKMHWPGREPSGALQISLRLYRQAISVAPPSVLRRWSRRGDWKKRKLNPLFVEWLMGWPTGLSLCDCSAMEFSRWSRHMRSELSSMPMASTPSIWNPPTETPEQMELL